MIVKSICVTIFLFITYSFLVLLKPIYWQTSQHQWQDNVIKAQRYLYSDSDTMDNVIIGSSLSCRLKMDQLPTMYNLSMGGLSPLDGLYIIMKKEKLPKNIFIEMNIMSRKENKDFISTFKSPVIISARKLIPSLRDENQPVAIFGKIIVCSIHAVGSRITSLVSPFAIRLKHLLGIKTHQVTTSNTNTIRAKSEEDELFNKMLSIQFKDYSHYPDSHNLTENFIRLKEYVHALKSKGVSVTFFEMPVDYKLYNLPYAITIRNYFYQYFPSTEYQYITIPDCTEYKTTDGAHLNDEGASKYTSYFKMKAFHYTGKPIYNTQDTHQCSTQH